MQTCAGPHPPLSCVLFPDTCTTGSVRLVVGLLKQVNICYNNTWGTICGGDGWAADNMNAPNVVCKQLGYTGEFGMATSTWHDPSIYIHPPFDVQELMVLALGHQMAKVEYRYF